jgi:hypothetical protein
MAFLSYNYKKTNAFINSHHTGSNAWTLYETTGHITLTQSCTVYQITYDNISKFLIVEYLFQD